MEGGPVSDDSRFAMFQAMFTFCQPPLMTWYRQGDPSTVSVRWGASKAGTIDSQTGQVLHTTDFLHSVSPIGDQGLQPGDKVGLLLDLEDGTMHAYLNSSPLGQVSPEGWGKLRGPLVWAVDLGHKPEAADGIDAVRVALGSPPPSPMPPQKPITAATGHIKNVGVGPLYARKFLREVKRGEESDSDSSDSGY